MAPHFPIRVYYSDTDAGGIGYHARYLDFVEHARTELYRVVSEQYGGPHQRMMAQRIGVVVKSVTVDYHRPAFLDDLLDVETTIEQLKRYSMTFLQRVFRGEVELATVKVRVGSLNLDTHAIVPFEPWFAEEVAKL